MDFKTLIMYGEQNADIIRSSPFGIVFYGTGKGGRPDGGKKKGAPNRD